MGFVVLNINYGCNAWIIDMAAKTQITNKGLELLASSSKATGQHWWIGWYALAFVPDELQETADEKIGPAMTKLTSGGDVIYNIFQGDVNGDGYQTTKASAKFKSVNYDSNIKKNYRYVLDKSGRNNLVTWVDGKNGLKGAHVYRGVKVKVSRDDNSIECEKSAIPLPAPLLYTGVKAAGEGWSVDGMKTFLGSGNGRIENFYPVDDKVADMAVPLVSSDFRNYEGYKNGLPKLDDGEQGYDDALNGSDFAGVDFDGWFPAVNTYTQNGETDMDEGYNQYCRQYWKVLSISNFNKYCAPVNASGLMYDENTGCRNMAKATKYFPVSDYSVTSTTKTTDNEYATGIKLKVRLKLNGNAEDAAYFNDVEMADDDNVATLNPSLPDDPDDPDNQHTLFNSRTVSFKFNRIGLYAVPMRQYGCSDDSSEMSAQYQIDTEAEPVLFAVCEWDSPVTLSDSGDGLSEFQSDIFVDLSSAVDDSAVIRESAVFYNLYEDDAIDWYKNQLVANASMAEALVNMQIEMGYLRDQKSAHECCPSNESMSIKETVTTGMKNLVDAMDYDSNSVRNRLSQEEGKPTAAVYSDIVSGVGSIGYPHDVMVSNIYARKSVSDNDAEYSAFACAFLNRGETFDDAVFDGRTYADMVPSINEDGATSATVIGGLLVRTKLYYELYSFVKPDGSSNSTTTFDYPDDAANNALINATGSLTDYFGSDDTLDEVGVQYVTITKTASGVSTKDGLTVTLGFPSELNGVSGFVEEINRSLENYETKREYRAYYAEGTSGREYKSRFKRTTLLKLPKTRLYKRDKDAYSAINRRLSSSGWRIPTTADWTSIIKNTTEEKAGQIRSGSHWKVTGGTGGVYPLSGAMLINGVPRIVDKTVIYLAIADDDEHVVRFDGKSFNFVDIPVYSTEDTNQAYPLTYLNVLCVSDATKITDGSPKYSLGDDSYALMEGSVVEGRHCVNASEISTMSASSSYSSMFGGAYNKVNESSYDAILGGHHNELVDTVYSVVFGDNNQLMSNGGFRPCRMLVSATHGCIKEGATSVIFAESTKVAKAYQSSIFGDSVDIDGIYCSRFSGQYATTARGIYFSDVSASEAYHLPLLAMCTANVTDDHLTKLPDSLEYDTSSRVVHGEFNGRNVYFLRKAGDANGFTDIVHSSVGGYTFGLVNAGVYHSDIRAQSDAHAQHVWFDKKTLESVRVNYSTMKLCESSVTSGYVDEPVKQSFINFSDIALGQSVMLMSAKSGSGSNTHSFNYGVAKISYSFVSQCDCSYVYETGTKHYLENSSIRYSTLVGSTISLTSNSLLNTHIYGSLSLPRGTSLYNHIVLGGVDGSDVGAGSASSYISDFGSYITANTHSYPMVWSMGGVGLYMNKIMLGDKGVPGGSSPNIGDVLTVVGVEGNLATVAWMPGGISGKFGTVHLELVFKYPNESGRRGDFDDYAKNPWACLNGVSNSIYVNGIEVTNTSTVIDSMNSHLDGDIKFKTDNNRLILHNDSASDAYTVGGTARCDIVSNTINPPGGDGTAYGWQMWDTTAFQPYSLGNYSASLSQRTVSAGSQYEDVVRDLAFGCKTSPTAGGQGSGELCSATVGPEPQTLVCKWVVDISYRKV